MEAAILDTINRRIDDQTKLMENCTNDIKSNLDEMRSFLLTWDVEREARLTKIQDDFKSEMTCVNERTEREFEKVNARVDCCVTFKKRVITIGQVVGAIFALSVTLVGLAQRW
jgi:hypothetical protein